MEAGEALPQDVLIEILINLPVKSLVRFRCVSKYWCSLIRSPNFVSRHLKQDCNECVLLKRVLPGSPQGTTGDGGREILSFHDPDSLDLLVSPDLSLPPQLDHLVDGLFFGGMSTCNGLVCLAICDIFVLCNPALREFEVLPPSPFACPEGYYGSTAAMGFGYDAMADAYKVVNLLEIEDKENDYPESYEDASFRIDLYNSSTNSWKLIDAMVPKVINNSQFVLFFNGACHWQHEFGDILSFDLSTEVFRHFEYPHFGDEKFAKLVVLNQCLSLVRVGGWGDGSQHWKVDPQLWADDPDFVEIWVMKEYGVKESWTKEFVIGPYAFNYPMLLLKNEWLLVITNDNQLASCALHGNEIRKFHFYDKDESMRAVILKESLISLKQVIFRPKED